ncbi:MAG: hypothetical protein JF610_14615 [Acidobacteria bacterium]|jgi:hypothetical protein|nr:hypothetical protein [Acidobacteriota bacterium]
MIDTWFQRLPLAAVFVLAVAVVLLSLVVGYRVGLRRLKDVGKLDAGPIGSIVGAMLGLLAFILAFTFGIAASRFDTRKQLLLDEVNAIGTAVLRADLIPEPHASESRRLLKAYVDIRVAQARRLKTIETAITESEAIQHELWTHAVQLAKGDLHSVISALYVESLNNVIDLHTTRVTVALRYRIPERIWLALLTVSVLTMIAVGYQFGLTGRGNPLIAVVLALAFSSVVLLIADLDRATQGALQVSQEPMLKLQEALNKAP